METPCWPVSTPSRHRVSLRLIIGPNWSANAGPDVKDTTIMSFLVVAMAAMVLVFAWAPGLAYVVARTVAGGRAAGFASCIGTGIGAICHVVAAALGLSLPVA